MPEIGCGRLYGKADGNFPKQRDQKRSYSAHGGSLLRRYSTGGCGCGSKERKENICGYGGNFYGRKADKIKRILVFEPMEEEKQMMQLWEIKCFVFGVNRRLHRLHRKAGACGKTV